MTVRLIPARAPLSAELHEACAPFGVLPVRPGTPLRNEHSHHVGHALESPGVVLVTGPSGSGKTTLLAALRRSLAERGRRVIRTDDPASLGRDHARSVVDCLPGDAAARIGALSRAGLADATLFARTPAELSAGERARLALAADFVRARAGDWVVADEFASVLDRATAQSVSRTVTKWAKVAGIGLVLASAHEDLTRFVHADRVVRLDHAGSVRLSDGRPPIGVRLRFEDGTRDDYAALAAHHYRGGRPATRVLIRRAVRTLPSGDERTAGVLVVSMPTLNGAWRDLAWPGRYTSGDKRARARRLNRELRCLSRVIVEPSSRGLGIARALVADYLRSPLTSATEAVAQMGAYCPFFERAGMRAYPLATGPVDARWLDALAARGIDAARGIVPERADELAEDPLVQRELERWVRDRKLARGLRGVEGGVRVRAAASLASTPAVAYAAGRSG
ncbi:MAG: ATPase, T2SS/T4P/T4SS family [Phycisphaerales bacterium]